MAMNVLRAVILGAPASGKGTIAKRIVEKYGFIHISPGDLLRLNVAKGTSLGKSAKEFIDQGKLVPDNIIVDSVLGRIAEINGTKSWLLDGFPRTLEQANRLQAAYAIDAVINLQVPESVIIERVKGRWVHLASGRVYNVGFNAPKVPFKDDLTGEDLVQRPDDHPDIVARRLKIYKEATEPILTFYNKNNLVKNISGNTTNEIWPLVVQFLDEKMKIAVADRQ